MSDVPERRPRVVLRYEDRWDDLLGGLAVDRRAGAAPSALRDALTAWLDPGSFTEVGSLVRRAASSYRGGDTVDETAADEVSGDGLVAGWGRLDGALLFVVADDPAAAGTVRGPAASAKAAGSRPQAFHASAEATIEATRDAAPPTQTGRPRSRVAMTVSCSRARRSSIVPKSSP